jgi:hypothetical protein
LHVNTPLDHRHFFGIRAFGDPVYLTAGAYLGFGQQVLLGIGVGTLVTGPKLFAARAVVNNWRF